MKITDEQLIADARECVRIMRETNTFPTGQGVLSDIADRLEALTQPSGKVSDEQVERAVERWFLGEDVADCTDEMKSQWRDDMRAALEAALPSAGEREETRQARVEHFETPTLAEVIEKARRGEIEDNPPSSGREPQTIEDYITSPHPTSADKLEVVRVSAPLHDALQRWRDEDHEETIALSREQVIEVCEEFRALSPRVVTAKPLEWEDVGYGLRAETAIGTYLIERKAHVDGRSGLVLPEHKTATFPHDAFGSDEELQRIAQSRFESLALSAVTLTDANGFSAKEAALFFRNPDEFEALLSALETIDLPTLRERLDESLKRLALGGQSNG